MFLLIFKIDKKRILQIAGDGSIASYQTAKDVLDNFSNWNRKWTADYESAMSATLGMMNTQPLAVEFKGEASELPHYVIDETIMKYSGLGYANVIGIEIKEEFLEGKYTIDMWKESMIAGGIKDPMESEIIDVINFSL